MNVAIIGCGLIGEKRAKVLGNHKLVAAVDPILEKAQKICLYGMNAIATTDWKEVISRPDVDIVIISTSNNWLAEITNFALENGKHVLVEKPAAKNSSELEPILTKLKSTDRLVKVGFNLRYHPSFQKAKQLLDSGDLGHLMFIRARYGHGGRLGYDKEWRASPEIAGGGELLDQGIHLIDLSRWIMGDFSTIEGFVDTFFWDMPVEDNGFLSLRTNTGKVAWLHASCTEWKNMFSMEIYCKLGKLQIDGLGGSYGLERLTYYKMLPEMGPPETVIWEYPGEDKSWKYEFDAFIKAIEENGSLNGDIYDAYEALKIVDNIYGGKYL